MIWMDVELEYLIKAWEQERRSLRNTEPVGAETVRGRKDVGARETCRRRHRELGHVETVGAVWMEGNQLGISKVHC
jgi:hypothetical protein